RAASKSPKRNIPKRLCRDLLIEDWRLENPQSAIDNRQSYLIARISRRAKRVRKVLTLPPGTNRSTSRLVSAGCGKGALLSASDPSTMRLSNHQRVSAPLAR